MGTRADFYIGRGESAEWLGSIAWDGHPEKLFNRNDFHPHFRWGQYGVTKVNGPGLQPVTAFVVHSRLTQDTVANG